MYRRVVGLSTAFVIVLLGGLPVLAQGASPTEIEHEIQIGKAIAPVALNTVGKNLALVYLGSYAVNAAGGCNDCHTNPPYAAGGNPYMGQPKKINVAGYLAGGMNFGGGIVSRNLTPDDAGLPAGLTLTKFKMVIHTGEDPIHPGRLLQVMPWPVYGNLSDTELNAIYAYLTAIPSIGR